MLAVAEAQARLLALAEPLPIETVLLAEAAGRFAASAVAARRTQPAADLSAMDGYAIRFADLPGPWRVVGESAAGAGLDRAIGAGEAARIFTGAPLPAGADTILIQEETSRDGDRVSLTGDAPARQGLFVRPKGSDFTDDAPLIAPGARLTPARIALAAIGGHGCLAVRRRPCVTILATGDELVEPGAPTAGVMLPSSNGPMLAAMLGDAADVTLHAIVRDDLDALAQAITEAAAHADILVTIGGASVGDHDLVRPALSRAGAELDFWRVAMRPGKPLMAGRLGGTTVLGLPGNPVSAFVTATLFLRPLVAHLAGAADPLPTTHYLPIADTLPANGERAAYLRARIADGALHVLPDQDSASLSTLAAADALVIRPPHAPALPAAASAAFLPLA
ncbi:molybdopterin molybdotransferase MoeA [Sphingomonas sp. BIUV-7]|uniref:Molybdopterin molybdenumtransferase n=1 Tax=Sphingomonas natans TaxID=3063330 RepID=A0ABT8YFK3_9SPHN|nr:gephyrin-like molybdotransferase Glp [Sphingomonas sp. BIUV-7]MDO6416817.1 molybdopterin molybdotransferase MoeA [Sphingomonas sp. BIUV-7]